MAISLTVDYVRRQFLSDMTRVDHDEVLAEIIVDVMARAVEYLDQEDITGQDTMPADMQRPLAKQVAYEYRRRNDTGLSSISFPDGSVNKYEEGEWVKGVQQALDRHIIYYLGSQG